MSKSLADIFAAINARKGPPPTVATPETFESKSNDLRTAANAAEKAQVSREANDWIALLGIGGLAAGAGLGVAGYMTRERPDLYLEKEKEAIPGVAITRMPSMDSGKKRVFPKQAEGGVLANNSATQALADWAPVAAILGLAKAPLTRLWNTAHSHLSSLGDASEPVHIPYFLPAAALGVPAAAGITYAVTANALEKRKKNQNEAELNVARQEFQDALKSEYNEARTPKNAAEALGQALDLTFDRYVSGTLWMHKQATKDMPPAPMMPNLGDQGVKQTDSPIKGWGGMGLGLASVLALGLGGTSYGIAKRIFDKTDPRRLEAKAIMDAVKYKLQAQPPRILISPTTLEEEEDLARKEKRLMPMDA